MNILKRLFHWVQSGPVDFCYVSGEWGFKKGKGGPGPSSKVLGEEKIVQIPEKMPPRVAVSSNGNVAARVTTPVAANVETAPEPVIAASEVHDPVLAELFSSPAPPQDQDAYAHIHAER